MTADLGPAARPRPVPSPEDHMADARTDTPHTFRTYLDATERDQLDARAAAAEAERDEATEDRDLLRAENANLTAGLRTERVKTGRLEGDLRSQTRAVREALAARDEASRICGEAGIEIDRLRAEQDRLTTALVRARRLLIAANIIQPEQEIPATTAALGSPPRRAQEPQPGQFCAKHFSWLCQAGQGRCQNDDEPTP